MNSKNKYAAGILAASLGVIGLHWFYLGKRLLGIIHLVVFAITFLISEFVELPFSIFLLICFIHGVRFFLMPDNVFEERYQTGQTEHKSNGKDKYLTAGLAFILGFLGFHRFYLGGDKNKQIGFTYLIFFSLLFIMGAIFTGSKDSLLILFFIPFLILCLETLYFLFCSKESFNEKYNQQHSSLSEGKNRLLAGLLAFKFGNIGVHHLYTGHIKKSFIYIILTVISVGVLISYTIGLFVSIVLEYVGFINKSKDMSLMAAKDYAEFLDVYISLSHFSLFINESGGKSLETLISNPFLLLGLGFVIISIVTLIALRILSFITGYKILSMSEDYFINSYIKK